MEPILVENKSKYTVFPVVHQDIWTMYEYAIANFWTVDEIDFSKDLKDWVKLTDDERFFIKNVLAFFAASDGIVNENLILNFYNEVQIAEMRQFYASQIMMESIHSHCVAPETQILTEKGYKQIGKIVNENVSVWNGSTWSEVKIQLTGQNRKLFKVVLSNGITLECTEGHKWHLRGGPKKRKERTFLQIKETKDLVKGDIITQEWNFPVLNLTDPDNFQNPYTHGFFCGDGSYNAKKTKYPMAMLCYKGNKQHLIHHLDVSSFNSDKYNNIICYFTGKINKPKFFVPINYSIKTKLKWFAGVLDADGCTNIAPSKKNKSIQLSNIHLSFLKDIQLMLSSIDILSNIKTQHEARQTIFEGRIINSKKIYIMYISCYNTIKLVNLGLSTKRLILRDKLTDMNIKEHKSLVTVIDILDEGRVSDTYCFNEPINHTGIFNGILTGQCYAVMIETYVKNEMEKNKLFSALENNSAVKLKGEWALKWITNGTFAERLLAFILVEGVFFSGSFCAIYWLKKRGLMPGLTKSNEFISRDEALHCNAAIALYSKLVNKISPERVHEIFKEAVEIEKVFITESLPVKLIGMNSEMMKEYIEFVADYWLSKLNYSKVFHSKNPFDFMSYISLQDFGNFFETRISAYRKHNVGVEESQKQFSLDEDF